MPARSEQQPSPAPILGVFDSGVGGLTVLRSLLNHVPAAEYIYLGDTARLPYGSKSRETIVRFAVSSARFLLEQGAEMLVIACNTATALALEEIRDAVFPVSVVGVIEPGARAAAASLASSLESEAGRVLVLATAATVHSHAYAAALSERGVLAMEKACPLLVPLVEEGWITHPVTREVVRIYVSEALAAAPAAETLLLGCTHYPLLRPVIEQELAALGRPLRIIDSAEATALAVRALLDEAGRPAAAPSTILFRSRFFATDSATRFAQLGSHFLGRPIDHVQHVDLGG